MLADSASTNDNLPHVLNTTPVQGDQLPYQHSPAQHRLSEYEGQRVSDSAGPARVQVVDCQDVGPDIQHEFPNLSLMQHGNWPPIGSSQEPRRASSSGSSKPNQVPSHDSLGRPLAPCGCLLRTPPPSVPTAPTLHAH